MIKINEIIIASRLEKGMLYSGFLSPSILAFFAIIRIRMPARPPEIAPPIPMIFVNPILFVNIRIMNRTNGILIVKSHELDLFILKSNLKVSINAIERER